MFFNKLWKRILIVFIVIFLLFLSAGIMSVNYIDSVTNSKNIHTDIVVVNDKLYGNSSDSDYYVILGTNNKTYGIMKNDGYGQKMFDIIQIGKKYEFIVQEPSPSDSNQQTHILRVDNATG